MMIELKNISFSYENNNADGQFIDIDLTIPTGQIVLICGESGCGKTTLTRLVNGLIPNYYEGELKGSVLIDGQEISEKPLYEIAPLVGSVFQNPRSQFFSVDTTSELAFGCENLGFPEVQIKRRMKEVSAEFQVEDLLGRSIFALSGGEKQKIACGSVAMPQPDIFVLDEPSSNLDIKSINELAKVIALWKKQKKTVLIAEHRLSYLMGIADRVLYMKDGKIERDLTAEEFQRIPYSERSRMGLRSLRPVSFKNHKETVTEKEQIQLHNFCFSYNRYQVLNIDSLCVPEGCIIGVIGNNGVGKTTFARCLCGLEKKSSGKLILENKEIPMKQRLNECYMVMQNPSHQLFTEDVLDEVLLSMDGDEEENQQESKEILSSLNLQELKERHPMSLSGGEQQRVAIAGAMAAKRKLLVFDEPTSGLDFRHMGEVAEILKRLQKMGKTSFIITHDPELLERCCDYFVFIEEGSVLWHGGWSLSNIAKLADFFETGEK